MRLSVSQYLSYTRNPWEWYCTHVKKRISIHKANALRLGVRYHEGMEAIYNGAPAAYAAKHVQLALTADADAMAENGATPERVSRFRSEAKVIVHLVENFTFDVLPFPVKVLAVEHTLEAPLGAGHTIMGRADAIVTSEDEYSVWHNQHRTFAWNRHRDSYFATRQLDPYELTYRYLIGTSEFAKDRVYGGTLMLLGIKHSSLIKAQAADRLFDCRPVSIRTEHVDRLLNQMEVVANEMDHVKQSGELPYERFDTWLNRGGYPSEYFDVYMGRASLDDPTKFTDAPSREVTVPEDAEA